MITWKVASTHCVMSLATQKIPQPNFPGNGWHPSDLARLELRHSFAGDSFPAFFSPLKPIRNQSNLCRCRQSVLLACDPHDLTVYTRLPVKGHLHKTATTAFGGAGEKPTPKSNTGLGKSVNPPVMVKGQSHVLVCMCR